MKLGNVGKIILAGLLFLSAGIAPSANAELKGNSGKGKSSSSNDVRSAWLNPPSSSKKPLVVQAGRTVPTKFRLVVNNIALTSTSSVQVSLNSLASCDAGAQVKNSAVLATSTPAPVASASASSSASTPESEEKPMLTSVNGVFNFNWKVIKNQPAGCYTLTASKEGVSITSPILRVKGSK